MRHRIHKLARLWRCTNFLVRKREEFFTPLGVTNITEFVDPSNPNRVGLLMDVPDMDALASALDTPEAVAAEERDGVVRETLVILVQA
jgi:hypothetical protein